MRLFISLFLLFLTTAVFAHDKPKLMFYRENYYSQFGEDGMIAKIFEIIGTTSKVAIEFGAWDGFLYSNTANLWAKDPSWTGILIESEDDRFKELVANVAPYHCIPIHQKVGITPQDSLEAILQEAQINTPIDLLSIDVDGDDYHIFESLQYLRPRVIICEYNVSIPVKFDIYSDYGNYMGCSVAALQRIAAHKGYTFIALTDTNCFFVRNDEFLKFADYDTDPDHLQINDYLSFIISDYACNYKIVCPEYNADAWGWSQKLMPDELHGNIVTIPGTISREKPCKRQFREP